MIERLICWLKGHDWKHFEQDLGNISFDITVDKLGREWRGGSLEGFKRYTTTPESTMVRKFDRCMRCYKFKS